MSFYPEERFSLPQYDGATPSRMQIIGKLCALLNIKEHQVTLDTLHSSFGKTEISGSAASMRPEEVRNKTERPHPWQRAVCKAKGRGITMAAPRKEPKPRTPEGRAFQG